MSARPLQSRNGVALQELYNRLKDIDLAIRSLEELERIKATVPTLAMVKQILQGRGLEKLPPTASRWSNDR